MFAFFLDRRSAQGFYPKEDVRLFGVLEGMNPIQYLENCERLLSSNEVASLLNIHQETVYRYKNSGVLKHIRVGRAIKFDPLDVLAYLRGQR
jgi:excisionase family DNA binding protein